MLKFEFKVKYCNLFDNSIHVGTLYNILYFEIGFRSAYILATILLFN